MSWMHRRFRTCTLLVQVRVSLKHDGTDGTDGTLIAIAWMTKSILRTRYLDIFWNANQSLGLYVVTYQVRTKYISFVNVWVLIIFGNFDHFAFWPIARLSIVPSPSGHIRSCLPVPTSLTVMLSPRVQSGLEAKIEAKILASASA